jgi:gliding motility-associated lipoprotein GldH
MKGSFQLLKIFILIFLFNSCDQNGVFDQYVEINKTDWDRDSVLQFNFEIEDTLSVYHIFINNRITAQYPYSRMYLFIETSFPDNKTIKDTLECYLAEQSGRLLGKKQWLGKGFGDIYSNKIPYKTNIRFPNSGEYTVSIEQGMRDKILPHVLDVGLRVEKAN